MMNSGCNTLASTGENLPIILGGIIVLVCCSLILLALSKRPYYLRHFFGLLAIVGTLSGGVFLTSHVAVAAVAAECPSNSNSVVESSAELSVAITSQSTSTSTTPTISGTGTPGSEITILINNTSYVTTVGVSGAWSIVVTSPLAADQTYQLQVSAKLGDKTTTMSHHIRITEPTCDGSPSDPQTEYISWQNQTWWVRDIQGDPGNNDWGRRLGNVCVLTDGSLRMAIQKVNNTWYSSEVDLEGSTLGYGKYSFTYELDVTTIPSNAVLGMFVYDKQDAGAAYREIDMEITRWGDPQASSMWYSVQDVNNHPERQSDHDMPTQKAVYTSEFIWQAGQVYFRTVDASGTVIGEHVVTSGIPTPGQARPSINFWMMDNQAPMDGSSNPSIRILSFDHKPGITHNLVKAANFASHFESQTYWSLRNTAHITSNRLTLPATTQYSEARAGSVLDLNNSSYQFHIDALPVVGNYTTESFMSLTYDAENYIRFFVSGGDLCGEYVVSGASTRQCFGSFDEAAHSYLRFVHTGSTLLYQSSPNGMAWTTLWSPNTPLSSSLLSTLRPTFTSGYYGNETNPGSLVIDSIN